MIVPAVRRLPPFGLPPRNRRDFLLQELGSALIAGTRADVQAAALYARGQKVIAPDLMSLLVRTAGVDEDRWALIAASLLSSFGVPRPTIAVLRSGKDSTGADYFSGSLITIVLQRLGDSAKARERLIHQLLTNSDIASWGVGVTLREYVHEPSLLRELREMLRSARPGALYVARDLLPPGRRSYLQMPQLWLSAIFPLQFQSLPIFG